MRDFVEAFDHKRILSNYLGKNGYPVVNVDFYRKNIKLSGKKFSLYPNISIDDQKPWKIPLEFINIRTGKLVKAKIYQSKKTEVIPLNVNNDPIIVSRNRLLGELF